MSVATLSHEGSGSRLVVVTPRSQIKDRVEFETPAWKNPLEVIDELRARGSIARTPDGYLVLDYAGCQAAYRNSSLVPGVRELSKRIGLPVDEARLGRSLSWADGAEHTNLRRVVAPWFSHAQVQLLRRRLEDLVEVLLVDFESSRGGDFMAAVANRIPGAVFCWMMGAPSSHGDRLLVLSEAILKVFTGDPAHSKRIADATAELGAIVFEIMSRKQTEPGDDLMSTMLAAVDANYTIGDVASMAFEMLAASSDNTAHSIGIAVHLLTNQPAQFQRLCQQPDLVPRAVEECGRYEPRVRTDCVVAREPTTLLDVDVETGSVVTLSLLGANFDPSVFPDPHNFDVGRQSSREHLGFGAGRHYCLGSALARMEIEVALHAIATRWSSIQAVDDAIIERTVNTAIRTLPIAVTTMAH